MSVITISSGAFSGGKLLAECLASRLRFRCIDRDTVVEKASTYGVSPNDLRQAFLMHSGSVERFHHQRYLYLALIQAALAEEVRTGRVVYFGNAGHLLLKADAAILRVRAIAPLDFRIRMAQDQLKLSTKEVIWYIRKRDREMQRWIHYLYGVDWNDPALYDLVVNLDQMDVKQTCRLVAITAKSRCFEFNPQYQAAMDDLALASRVRANLALDPATSRLELQLVARSGILTIQGRLACAGEIGEIERVASAVSGLRGLNLDQLALAAPA